MSSDATRSRAVCGAVVAVVAIALAGSPARSQQTATALVHLRAHRFGLPPACGTAFSAEAEGLLLTTYKAVRGAERLDVITPGGADRGDDAQVASYSTRDDLAVLHLPADTLPALRFGRPAASGDRVVAWAMGEAGSSSRQTLVVAREGPLLRLSTPTAQCGLGGPLVNPSGDVVGVVSGRETAIPVQEATTVVGEARENVAANRLLSVREVARRENHLYGSVVFRADVARAVARITPLEQWHWPGVGLEQPLPLTFAGPLGNYRVALLLDGAVRSETTFEVQPGVLLRVFLTPGMTGGGGGGLSPWLIGGLGAAAALGGGAVLMGGGGDGAGSPDQTGSLIFRVRPP